MSTPVLRPVPSAPDPSSPGLSPLGTPLPADPTALSHAALAALRAAEDAVRRVRSLHVRIHRHAVSPLDTHGGTMFADQVLGTFECAHCQHAWPCPTVAAITHL